MTLLQNDTTLNYKTRQIFLLQNEANLYYKTRQLFYYKMRKVLQKAPFLLQNAAGITKCANYYKTRHNNCSLGVISFSVTNHDLLITLTSGFVKNNQHESDQYTLCDVFLVRNYLFHLALPMLCSRNSQFFFESGTLEKFFVSFSFPFLFEHPKAKHDGIIKLNVLVLLLR